VDPWPGVDGHKDQVAYPAVGRVDQPGKLLFRPELRPTFLGLAGGRGELPRVHVEYSSADAPRPGRGKAPLHDVDIPPAHAVLSHCLHERLAQCDRDALYGFDLSPLAENEEVPDRLFQDADGIGPAVDRMDGLI